MESSMCSCDGDTMQDEPRRVHHSSDAYELHLFSLYILLFSLSQNGTKLTLFFCFCLFLGFFVCFFVCPCQKMTVVVGVSKVFQQCDNQQNYK